MGWDADGLSEAVDFAAAAHGGQTVPGSGAPYVVHLLKVAMEIARVADGSLDADLALKCAVLHDCVEDAGVSVEALRARFGEAVAEGVAALSKDAGLPKEERMRDSLERIRRQPREVWLVKLADRVTNLGAAPEGWSKEKRRAYREEARGILEALGAAHGGLAERLAGRITAWEADG